jgi:hypothetical protein
MGGQPFEVQLKVPEGKSNIAENMSSTFEVNRGCGVSLETQERKGCSEVEGLVSL